MWFIFFDILWLIICNIGICFIFEWLFVMQLLVNSKFYIKKIFFFIIFFFILIKSNKQVDTTNSFNKWVGLTLRNLDLFNKHVGLVLTYIVEYSWLDIKRHGPDTRTRIATPNKAYPPKKKKKKKNTKQILFITQKKKKLEGPNLTPSPGRAQINKVILSS